ncbi:MAG: nitrogen regulation protein NR(II) [bacterium]
MVITLLETKNLKRLKLFTIGLVVLILWSWELLEHFFLLPSQTLLFNEMLPTTLLLIVLLNFLFETVIKSHQKLEESNRHLVSLKNYQASILDSSPNAIIAVDQEGLICSFNRQGESMTGYAAKDAIGMEILRLFQDGQKIREALERAQSDNKEETIAEAAMITKRGGQIPVSVVLSRIEEGDHKGQGIVLIVEDLREKKRLERRLVVSEKMAAVSQMAAGLAHAIRNPLASIGVNLRNLEDQIRMSAGKCEECEKYLLMISSESERLDRLVDNFVRSVLPKKIEASTDFCHLDDILNAALERCRELLQEKKIEVVENFQSHGTCIECDREQLSHAFCNLVQNAVEAMPASGKLTIEIRQEGDWSQVKVWDTGRGISPENLDHIFDLYFTTKPDGLGIGLSFVSWVIGQHGGKIEIESETNKGTCVSVWLPIKKGNANVQRTENHN